MPYARRVPHVTEKGYTFLSLNEKCRYMYYNLTEYSIDSLAHACALLKSKLPISNFPLLAIFVTDGARVDVGFAGTRPTSKSVGLSWRVNSKLDASCRTNVNHSEHRHQPAASLANRMAGVLARGASAVNAELHQLACVVPGAIVKAAALYTNWLAPGFNIDSCERTASVKISTASESNFRLKAAHSVRELTSISNCSHRSLAKTLNW